MTRNNRTRTCNTLFDTCHSLICRFVSRHSLDAALASASAVCRAVDIVLADHVPPAEQFDSQSNTQPDSLYIAPLDDELAEVRHVFCAVRPPGHHAGHSGHAQAQSQGFCLINNVAVGVNYALNRGLTRVVIYDFGTYLTLTRVTCH